MKGVELMPRARRERAAGGGELAASLADEALLAGVSAGSEAHFNALYARYCGRISAFASARTGKRADAWQLDVFWARHFEELPIEEFARRTMRSIDAVRSGLHRAKRILFATAELRESQE